MTDRHWLQFYAADAPAEIDADAYPSLVHLLDEAMQRFAARTAFISFDNSLSYADVDRHSRAFAAFLQNELGVTKGDRIAVMMPNLLAFPLATIGIARIGAVQVNVNPMYTPRELEHQLNDSGAEIMVIFSGATPTLAEIVGNTKVKHIITIALGDGGANALPSPPIDARLHDTIAFADALTRGAKLIFTPVELRGEDLLLLQYTGATTGLSKGAVLSHRNLIANIAQFKVFHPRAMRPGEETIVTALPLYHIFALMVNFLTYFSLGATNHLVANARDMDSVIDAFKAAKLSVFMGVNTMYAGLAAHPRIGEVNFSNLLLAGGGGAAMIDTVSARWEQITGSFIFEGYGLSETSPVISFNPQWNTAFSGTTGLPLPSTDIKLLDDDDREAPIGEPGEICVKGPQVMRGYWNQPEANAVAFTADGYFRTGDIGAFDARGMLKIVDRKKDMIIVSAFNVYPNEVEAVATACPGVAECACVGIPDAKTGEAVALFVVKSAGSTLTETELTDYCRKQMAAYKVPRIVRFVDALPKSGVGKILRRELRKLV